MTKKKEALPNIGQVADELYVTREKRYALNKEVQALEKRETELRNIIISTLLNDPGIDGVMGKVCRVALVEKLLPTVVNWDELYKYVKKTGSFELLQKRLLVSAVEERWDSGKKVPGVDSFKSISLSINKVK